MTRIRTIAAVVWLELLRKKDLYVLAILLGTLLAVLGSVSFFGVEGSAGYVKDVGLLLAWVFAWIMAVNVSCRELPQEEQRGTIFALLAKPVSRLEVVAGKWLGCWTVVAAGTALFYLLVVAAGLLKGGAGAFVLRPLVQGYALHAAALAVICAMGLALSTRTNYDAAATLAFVFSAALFLLTPRVPAFMVYAKGLSATGLMLLYNLMPHLELFDMRRQIVYNYPGIPWGVFGLIALYGACVTLAFLLAAWLAYRHRRFARGSMVHV